MSRLAPTGLAARFALLLLAALIGVNVIAAMLLAREGSHFDRGVRIQQDMGRLIALVAALEEVDLQTGEAILSRSRTGYSRFSIDPAPISPPEAPALTAMEAEVRTALSGRPTRIVEGSNAAEHAPVLMLISVRLSAGVHEGEWLNSIIYPLPPATAWGRKGWFFMPLVASLLGTLAVGLIFIRRLTDPLAELARAARAAGNGDRTARVTESGARELRQAAAAFNDMQQRIAGFDAERIRLVAAIGHDLRTPITSLRIRVEMIDEDALRDPMIQTLDDMAVIAEDLLQYARVIPESEDDSVTDLVALLRRLCEDRGASLAPAPSPVMLRLRPVAMTRAIGNLIDNAMRYAGAAQVCVAPCGPEIVVTIEDRGPGIPAHILDRVGEPFLRGEESRSHETGGSGLGLSIAREIIGAHGGILTLANRPSGGLRAEIRLPAGRAAGRATGRAAAERA